MSDTGRPVPWKCYAAELAGTGLLLLVGLSVVILDFGAGSPVARVLPDAGLRRAITGFLFGCTGAAIAISPLGKESGAHINPAVTAAFWSMGTLKGRYALGYALAQSTGAVLGTLPLLAWGALGSSVTFGATEPGAAFGTGWALVGETVATFIMVTLLFYFIRHPRLRAFTPALFPPLYAIMVFLEAPVSGTSTNPARSLGPAVIAGDWRAWWIYWVGPLAGALLAVAFYRLSWLRHVEIEVAKLYHFEFDRYRVLRDHHKQT